jgi:hypothetical protein
MEAAGLDVAVGSCAAGGKPPSPEMARGLQAAEMTSSRIARPFGAASQRWMGGLDVFLIEEAAAII